MGGDADFSPLRDYLCFWIHFFNLNFFLNLITVLIKEGIELKFEMLILYFIRSRGILHPIGRIDSSYVICALLSRIHLKTK